MAQQPYDPVGAAGGLFAPAHIVGNPEAEAAASAWNAAHLQTPPTVATGDNPAAVAATSAPSPVPSRFSAGPATDPSLVTWANPRGLVSQAPAATPAPVPAPDYSSYSWANPRGLPAPAAAAPVPAPTAPTAPTAPVRDRIALAMMNRGG